jgi:hypothetical protein
MISPGRFKCVVAVHYGSAFSRCGLTRGQMSYLKSSLDGATVTCAKCLGLMKLDRRASDARRASHAKPG